MAFLDRLFGRRDDDAMRPLYEAVVAEARLPHWYVEGAVPDTLDGRFDMVVAVMALVLMRLEESPEGAPPSALLTERFVDDMDAQVRQIGFGDMVVGKHIGRMMAMLGGRIGAYRAGLETSDASVSLDAALVRNLYRGEAPAPAAVTHVAAALVALRDRLRGLTIDAIMAGRIA